MLHVYSGMLIKNSSSSKRSGLGKSTTTSFSSSSQTKLIGRESTWSASSSSRWIRSIASNVDSTLALGAAFLTSPRTSREKLLGLDWERTDEAEVCLLGKERGFLGAVEMEPVLLGAVETEPVLLGAEDIVLEVAEETEPVREWRLSLESGRWESISWVVAPRWDEDRVDRVMEAEDVGRAGRVVEAADPERDEAVRDEDLLASDVFLTGPASSVRRDRMEPERTETVVVRGFLIPLTSFMSSSVSASRSSSSLR